MRTLSLSLAVAAVYASDPEELKKEFSQWVADYAKEYKSSKEELYRFGVWAANRVFVNAHNGEEEMGLHPYKMKLNHLGDMAHAEYKNQMLGFKASAHQHAAVHETFAGAAPAEWDWRAKGVVNDVKNQAQCGSCWAFSAVAAMEGAFNLKSNGTVPSDCKDNTCGPNETPCCSFSEQELVDCVNGGADDCNHGGDPSDGVDTIAKKFGGKINTEAEYPYTSGDGQNTKKCSAGKGGVASGISGFTLVKSGDEDAAKLATWHQPILSIGIDASVQSFQFYDSGVYVEPACKNGADDLDHGVAIVGYGLESDAQTPKAGQAYWLVRNSWGETWGMDGYIKMARNLDNQCGVATNAIYANVGSSATETVVV